MTTPTDTRPRLIYLSQLFDPEPTFKGGSFIADLNAQGFQVEVVTGFPNYPGGKLYDGYRIKVIQRDRYSTYDVTRLPMYPSHDHSSLRRIATYLSFMMTAFIYLTFRAQRADLIYVYYPTLTAGLAAVMAKLFRRTPVILDIQDMWPDSLYSSGMMRNRVMVWLVTAVCNLVYRGCDHIVVLSPGFKTLLNKRGVPADKITVIYNWAEEPPYSQATNRPDEFDSADGLRVLFAGNMGAVQQLETVLEAAGRLQTLNVKCVFYFMGKGVERDRLQSRAGAMGLTNVRFLPHVPLAQVQHFLAAADVLLVHLMNDPLFRITIPSKTQAYLYAGRPILMGVLGDAANLVQCADAGYVFRPGDAEDLTACIQALIQDGPERRQQMGQNGHTFYMETLCRQLGVATTIDVINRFRRRIRPRTTVAGDLV